MFKKTFYSLRNRNFRLFFIGQMISNTGNWLTNVALTLFVLKLTGSGLAIGILTACQYGPILFLSAWAGAISDRIDKRNMLLLTQSLSMAQSIGLAVLAFTPHPPVIGLYILAVIGGMLLSFDNPLRRSFVSEMVPTEDIPNAVVLYSIIVHVSRIIGPAFAGLLIITVGYGGCFSIDAISYLAVLFCLFSMRPGELHRQPIKAKSKGDVMEGLRYIRSMPQLWISFAMLTAIGTLSYNLNVTLPLFVTHSLHSSEGGYTLLYSASSFGAVISALIVANRSMVRMQHIIFGASAFGLSMLLLGLMPNVGSAIPAIVLVGMAGIVYMTSSTTIIQVQAKQEMHGRLLALQMVLMVGTSLIGGPLCGWIADIMGARIPIILGGIACLLSAVFGYVANRYYS